MNLEDADWIKRIKAGEREFFGNFFLKYEKNVLGFVVSELCKRNIQFDKELIKDIIDETFQKAYLGIDKFQIRDGSEIISWFCTIAKNIINDWLKEQEKFEKVINSFPSNNLSKLNPEGKLISKEKDEEISNACKKSSLLLEKYQIVLKLKYIAKYKEKEIAELLGISESAAKSLLNRARRKFKSFFSTEEEESIREALRYS